MQSPLQAATLLVTGSAGFIGSALVRHLVRTTAYHVVSLDALTYAGNLDSLTSVLDHPQHQFVHGDIGDAALVRELLERYQPVGLIHLAAESHVDRSIDAPALFLATNVHGTLTLLEESRRHWQRRRVAGGSFRFVHVSTDEVFGSLGAVDPPCTTATPYAPSSPYAASKAAADHLVRAWGHTYGLPVIVTTCSNNYGPYQFPEKLIPLMILNAIEGKPLPVYGKGANVRDWLFVEDHVAALVAAFERGRPGATYLIGARAERDNLSVVRSICDLVDAYRGTSGTRDLITFVADRPGHDLRYAIDANGTQRELGWTPRVEFERGLRDTVRWYIKHRAWWQRVLSGAYRGERLGLGEPR
ncbi:dTDP-glucose 4,6-dehydratase [Gemmatimonas sp.]|uniref:dTDP-glucose 4,6-dehydratase n=1 Tax=Gemmatimonas sp. TaxID=1962908 RepID=UPI003DA3BBA2